MAKVASDRMISRSHGLSTPVRDLLASARKRTGGGVSYMPQIVQDPPNRLWEHRAFVPLAYGFCFILAVETVGLCRSTVGFFSGDGDAAEGPRAGGVVCSILV